MISDKAPYRHSIKNVGSPIVVLPSPVLKGMGLSE